MSTGISALMQIVSNAATPAISSLLSSSKVQSALAKAPPADLVELSDQASQLQEVDGLFGGAAETAQATSPGMEMQNLLTSIYTGKPAVNVLG
jgi:hypothetical protein